MEEDRDSLDLEFIPESGMPNRVPTRPSYLLHRRRNSKVRTRKKSNNCVREVRFFKFEHRANRKTLTWKTRIIWF